MQQKKNKVCKQVNVENYCESVLKTANQLAKMSYSNFKWNYQTKSLVRA